MTKILAVDLEQAPYKTDLWNCVASHPGLLLRVLFSRAKDWSPIGSHDYREMPAALYELSIFPGRGLVDHLRIIPSLTSAIVCWKPEFVFISGYADPAPLVSIFLCVIFRRNYALHSDIFNNAEPSGKHRGAKRLVRAGLRAFVFRTAKAVFVCGVRGKQSALQAGCPEDKIFDFPYVVDRVRLQSDEPSEIPQACKDDLVSNKRIILFSGRMIARKGLSTLLLALRDLVDISNWIVWIEGGGPLFHDFKAAIEDLGLADRCRLLGFCQMSLHSWLLRNCHIVVVPSLQDAWGILVDEAMQMGKVIIASDSTGSAADRIDPHINGIIFQAGSNRELADALRRVITDEKLRKFLGANAENTAGNFGPRRNLLTLLKAAGIE